MHKKVICTNYKNLHGAKHWLDNRSLYEIRQNPEKWCRNLSLKGEDFNNPKGSIYIPEKYVLLEEFTKLIFYINYPTR